jgi:ketosteroid isomerase-like protein
MATDLAFSDSAATSVAAAFGAFAADDAAKSGKESAYVYGKAAIAQLFDPPPPTGLKWKPEIGTAARSGDFGFTVGSAGPRVVDPNTPPADPATAGHYFTIWRRDASGRWRYIID